MAHASCNNNKSDHLAAHIHSERWHEQNIIIHGATLSNELEAVATWAYRLAHQNGVSLWLNQDQFVPVI